MDDPHPDVVAGREEHLRRSVDGAVRDDDDLDVAVGQALRYRGPHDRDVVDDLVAAVVDGDDDSQ